MRRWYTFDAYSAVKRYTMKEKVMKAFWEGLADFVSSFWNAAKSQGFSVMLLLLAVVGLSLWIERLNVEINDNNKRHKEELAHLRNECRIELMFLHRQIDSLRLDLQRCIEARARVEAQNQYLKAELKKIKKHVYE